MKKNIILLFLSIFFIFLFLEFILELNGKYKNLTYSKLINSKSVYNRPFNSFQKYKHPDLDYIINNYFDSDGVKNYPNGTLTSEKKNIIGVFGDSFTENIGIDSKFEFSNILNREILDFTVVNYGIGGYNAEQAFIRFLENRHHDLKYIIYFFFNDDQIGKDLISFDENSQYKLKIIEINYFYQLIGKLNLTYFFIDSYYKIRSNFYSNHTLIDINNYSKVIANKIALNEINKRKKTDENFLNILRAFKNESEKQGAQFFVIVYPENRNIEYFKKTLTNKNLNIKYYILDLSLNNDKTLFFDNDGHWNEYGNLAFARNLKQILIYNNIKFNKNYYNFNKKYINQFYSKHKKQF
jgi:hypothetical protein